MKATFLSRTFTPLAKELQPQCDLTVQRFDWTATGGPKACQIAATGPENHLWRLLTYLGSPLYIYDESGTAEWWGMLTAIDYSGGGVQCSFDIADLANSVAALYTYQGDGQTNDSTAGKTAFSANSASVAIYKTKQLLLSCNNMSATEATSKRDIALAQRALPRARWRHGGGRGPLAATLTGGGLYDTLSWKYYGATVSGDVYAPTALLVSDKNRLGDANANAKIAQSFAVTCGRTYYIPTVRIYLQKVYSGGLPADSVEVSLHANNAGAGPGGIDIPAVADLETTTLAVANIGTKLDWHEFSLTGAQAYTDTTKYWIVVERSPANVPGGNGYYFVGTDEDAGYSGGDCLIYDATGGAWGVRSTAADAPFQVVITWDSITQIQDIVTTANCGQFLSGTVDALTALSSLPAPPYRAGDRNGLDLVTGILEAGVSTGRQLLAWVDAQRILRIEQEPAAASQPPIRVQPDGRVNTKWQQEDLTPRLVVRREALLEGARDLSDFSSYVYADGAQIVTGAAWSGGKTQITATRAPAGGLGKTREG